MATVTDPLNRATTNTYDRDGKLTNISQPNGLSIGYAYDNADRLQQKTLDGGRYFTYTYDGANNLTSVTDQNNKQDTWTYDGAGRVISTTDTLGNAIGYHWDKSSNLTGVYGYSYAVYQYGSSNRLLSVTLPDGNKVYYDYDENGHVFQIRYPGTKHNRLIYYYPNGWCRQIQDLGFPSNYYGFVYDYDNNGDVNKITSWAGTDDFTYDDNGRLYTWNHTPTSGNPTLENYSYDAAGNLTTKGNQTFTYNNDNQITNTGYTYDNNGNLINDGTYWYAYNAENQLTQVNKVSDNSLVATYTYDYNGLRISKTVSGVTTNFVWDTFGNLVRETTGGNFNIYSYDTNGNLIGFNKNSQNYYIYHTNLRGDIVTVTDYNNVIQAQYNYDPWGTQTSYTGTLTQPFRYAGYYFDSETGLYYCKGRYYSPTLGRFLTKDSYGYISQRNPQTLNLYSYCGNNPVNRVDPNGNVSGVIIDDNEKAYLKEIIRSQPGSGNAIWAQDTLDNGIYPTTTESSATSTILNDIKAIPKTVSSSCSESWNDKDVRQGAWNGFVSLVALSPAGTARSVYNKIPNVTKIEADQATEDALKNTSRVRMFSPSTVFNVQKWIIRLKNLLP